MKNFLFFTDVHIRLSSTRRRTDDIFEAQLKKLKWIGEKAKELNSEFIICGGDLGDSWDWKISMINKVTEVFKNYPCQVLSVIGNHDVPGRNPLLWKDTGIGNLHLNKVLRIMGPPYKDNPGFYNEHPESSTTPWSLWPFHSDTEKTNDLISGKAVLGADIDGHTPYTGANRVCIKVAIVHAPVGAETTPYCKGHKELFISDFDIALFGDIHTGWPVYDSLTGCKICNPGSLTRLTKKDMERKPQIGIVYEDGTVEYIEVPHTPAEDCFDMSGIDAEKQELGKGFLAAMAARKSTAELNPREYVELIGKAAGYSQEAMQVLKDAIND